MRGESCPSGQREVRPNPGMIRSRPQIKMYSYIHNPTTRVRKRTSPWSITPRKVWGTPLADFRFGWVSHRTGGLQPGYESRRWPSQFRVIHHNTLRVLHISMGNAGLATRAEPWPYHSLVWNHGLAIQRASALPCPMGKESVCNNQQNTRSHAPPSRGRCTIPRQF